MNSDFGTVVNIESRDYWFKVVECLQQNWALIDLKKNHVVVYFFHDLSGVFDEMSFSSLEAAMEALRRNGFSRYEEDLFAQRAIACPPPPFRRSWHPNGKIYSSGRFWIS